MEQLCALSDVVNAVVQTIAAVAALGVSIFFWRKERSARIALESDSEARAHGLIGIELHQLIAVVNQYHTKWLGVADSGEWTTPQHIIGHYLVPWPYFLERLDAWVSQANDAVVNAAVAVRTDLQYYNKMIQSLAELQTDESRIAYVRDRIVVRGEVFLQRLNTLNRVLLQCGSPRT